MMRVSCFTGAIADHPITRSYAQRSSRPGRQERAWHTLAVRPGSAGALRVALTCTVLAAAVALLFQALGLAQGAYAGIAHVVLPHAVWLVWLLWQAPGRHHPLGWIDGLMAVSLSYVLWFGLVPLINLARA